MYATGHLDVVVARHNQLPIDEPQSWRDYARRAARLASASMAVTSVAMPWRKRRWSWGASAAYAARRAW